MTGAFWPGLLLALIALLTWWFLAGRERYDRWVTRQTLQSKGYCPDCAMPYARCTCVDDFTL